MSNQDLVLLDQTDGTAGTSGTSSASGTADVSGSADCCPGLLTAPLDGDQAAELAKVFKALGDPVRLRLLSMIASRAGGEVCVCDLTPAFDLSQPTVSHHLKLLREAGLIDCERRGTWVYYWLVQEMTDRLAAILTRPTGAPAPDGAAS
ncbi:transcriptional regulator [Streptomyces griseofuscus]|uniref:Transcriptional regulator n=1 Tax=Streptomyces griseofuscus TaxID=146922 RepID=A0A7H1Q2D8_9ACTN|nr:metalloregulator ArsR/SmtB family transcription factor [Streptomyces griseofuscus]QNT94468.1 transcriptional regulator [Streptomyces griseofuscus]